MRMRRRVKGSQERLLAESDSGWQGVEGAQGWQETAQKELQRGQNGKQGISNDDDGVDDGLEADADELFIGFAERMHIAIEGIAFHILSSDTFDVSFLDPSGSKFTNRIPGSTVTTDSALVSFNSWLHEVSQEGSWIRDPTPRRLGWIGTEARDGLCDRWHVRDVTGGIAGAEADRVADAWLAYSRAYGDGNERNASFWAAKAKAEAEWRVREGLKYAWEPRNRSLDWQWVHGSKLCQLARAKEDGSRSLNLLLVGDSLTEQLATAVRNAFTLRPDPAYDDCDTAHVRAIRAREAPMPACDAWLGGALETPKLYCADYRVQEPSVCPNGASLNVMYIRHHYLLLSSHSHVYSSMPWSRMHRAIRRADVIVVNRGLHYRPDEELEAGLTVALKYLRLLAPETLLAVRSTPAGHPQCSRYEVPLSGPQVFNGAIPFRWDLLPRQQGIAERVAVSVGAVLLDVVPMTVLRPDQHKASRDGKQLDCVHYCVPGPVDGWAQLLLNALLKLLPVVE